MPSPVGGYCVMLFSKSSRSFSPSLPIAALSVSPEKDYQKLLHCCHSLKIEALSLFIAQRGSRLYDNSLKLLYIMNHMVCLFMCACTQFFSSLSVQLNSYALTYDRRLAGLIEALFTMCGGVTTLAFVCMCTFCLCVAEQGDINVYYSPSRLAIAPRAWL